MLCIADYISVYIILKLYNKGDAYDKEKIDIIGVPSTFGQRKLGVDLGPTAIRYAGLIPRLKQLDLDVNDKGDIKVSVVTLKNFKVNKRIKKLR